MVEARIPGTDTRVSQHPKDEFGQGATIKQANGEVKSGDQVAGEAQTKKDAIKVNAMPIFPRIYALHSAYMRSGHRLRFDAESNTY